jgi:hypothetical protein
VLVFLSLKFESFKNQEKLHNTKVKTPRKVESSPIQRTGLRHQSKFRGKKAVQCDGKSKRNFEISKVFGVQNDPNHRPVASGWLDLHQMQQHWNGLGE